MVLTFSELLPKHVRTQPNAQKCSKIALVCGLPAFQGHSSLWQFLKIDRSGTGHEAGMASVSLRLHHFTSDAFLTATWI